MKNTTKLWGAAALVAAFYSLSPAQFLGPPSAYGRVNADTLSDTALTVVQIPPYSPIKMRSMTITQLANAVNSTGGDADFDTVTASVGVFNKLSCVTCVFNDTTLSVQDSLLAGFDADFGEVSLTTLNADGSIVVTSAGDPVFSATSGGVFSGPASAAFRLATVAQLSDTIDAVADGTRRMDAPVATGSWNVTSGGVTSTLAARTLTFPGDNGAGGVRGTGSNTTVQLSGGSSFIKGFNGMIDLAARSSTDTGNVAVYTSKKGNFRVFTDSSLVTPAYQVTRDSAITTKPSRLGAVRLPSLLSKGCLGTSSTGVVQEGSCTTDSIFNTITAYDSAQFGDLGGGEFGFAAGQRVTVQVPTNFLSGAPLNISDSISIGGDDTFNRVKIVSSGADNGGLITGGGLVARGDTLDPYIVLTTGNLALFSQRDTAGGYGFFGVISLQPNSADQTIGAVVINSGTVTMTAGEVVVAATSAQFNSDVTVDGNATITDGELTISNAAFTTPEIFRVSSTSGPTALIDIGAQTEDSETTVFGDFFLNDIPDDTGDAYLCWDSTTKQVTRTSSGCNP